MSPEPEDRDLLLGRSHEEAALDRLLAHARAGHGAVLVIRGEAGVGKTALLDYAAMRAVGFQIRRIAGVESEMQLPFASLHQLCRPLLDRLDAIPGPQQAALSVALGMADGDSPDPFLVSLAALSLVSETSRRRPTLCIVDDAQWLDSASSQALAFVARRLLADSVAMAFAIRDPAAGRDLAGLPELRLQGLSDDDARALLERVILGPMDARARSRLLAESRGNPLALLELPRRLDANQLPGAIVERHGQRLPERIEGTFNQRLLALPHDARLLLLIAAAEPADDPLLVWRAASGLGLSASAAEAVASEGLLALDGQVRFRHPLVRSAAYRSASPEDRRAVHLALANASDEHQDPDRHAWHLAAAALGPDEQVALELERSAGRARSRGGLAAAAAFLRRSVALTDDATRGAGRALAAAQASLHAGEFDAALDVLATADPLAMDDLQRAQVDLLRAQVISASGALGEAPALLLSAAERLEPLDPGLARESYLDAWGAAMFAGNRANADMHEVARVVRTRPSSGPRTHATDLLLDGLSLLMTDGRAAAAPALRRGLSAFLAEDLSVEKGMRWSVIASCAAMELWDFETRDAVITRQVRRARAAGALAPLAFGLVGQSITAAWTGEFDEAARVTAKADAVTQVTGSLVAPFGGMLLAAFRGRDPEAFALLERSIGTATASGAGFGLQWAHWTSALLCNGLRRFPEALDAATLAWEDWPDWFVSVWASVEHIEAASRMGRPDRAAESLDRLLESTRVGGTDWALGIAARSRALLSEGEAAEREYRLALRHLQATALRPELARAHLVYGEWLRREQRRVDARRHLQTAHAMLVDMGAEAFAERARHELLATGAKVRQRIQTTRDELTPQEAHVAQLAADGRTNVEIGAELYLSPRTIEWHLKKVFTKLGITSRRALRDTLRRQEQGRLLADGVAGSSHGRP